MPKTVIVMESISPFVKRLPNWVKGFVFGLCFYLVLHFLALGTLFSLEDQGPSAINALLYSLGIGPGCLVRFIIQPLLYDISHTTITLPLEMDYITSAIFCSLLAIYCFRSSSYRQGLQFFLLFLGFIQVVVFILVFGIWVTG
jgi:hypothetical protein